MTLSKTHIIVIAVVVIIAIAAVAFVLLNNNGNGGNEKTIDDYGSNPILWVLGNTDGDQDIDRDDIAVIKAIIDVKGKASTYKYADANYDGVIDQKDVDYVQSMIDG